MLEALGEFMVWDGIAMLGFGGLILLGMYLRNPFTFMLIAWGIPLASLCKWLFIGEGFLTFTPYIFVIFMTVYVLVPRFVRSHSN